MPDRMSRRHQHATRQEPRSWLACDLCGESFRRAEHLQRHRRTHTGEKPFRCDTCNKDFNRPDSLRRHQQLHKRQRTEANDLPPEPEPEPQLAAPAVGSEHPEWLGGNPLMPTSFVPASPDLQQFEPNPGWNAVDQLDRTNWLPLATVNFDWNPFNLLLDTSYQDTGSLPDALGQAGIPEGFSSLESPVTSQAVTVTSPESTGHGSSTAAPDSAATYVDSGVTRLAKGKKRSTSIQTRHAEPSPSSRLGPRHGCRGHIGSSDESAKTLYLNQDLYDWMLSAFQRTCVDSGNLFEPFSSANFLTMHQLDRMVSLAVEHFLPTVPFVSKFLLLQQQGSALLYLALSTIGSRYELELDQGHVWSLTELLRRTVMLTGESLPLPDELELVQAKTLLCISLLFSGRSPYLEKGKAVLGDVCRYCRIPCMPPLAGTPHSFMRGLNLESQSRTKYVIWMLDCISAYQHGLSPVLSIDSVDCALPISDSIFNSTPENVESGTFAHGKNPSLATALSMLYQEKKVDPGIGEFGRVILIHGLFHQTWSVAKACRSTLLNWNPLSDHAQLDEESRAQQWLPSNPTYASWRNSACDCIDLLHWSANGQIGFNGGHEHPTVFFLHLSRVVLLCPIDRISEMVHGLIGSLPLVRAQADIGVREIFRWAQEDCYKARLSIIHAGVLLYHVRRHSLDSFYEPNGVFSAILCLWAYSCSQRTGSQSTSPARPTESDTHVQPLPSLIHLDRPCDDELVQLFITKGQVITPNMTGVGDICASGSPHKILAIGSSMLAHSKNWDLTSHYQRVLIKLQAKTSIFESALLRS